MNFIVDGIQIPDSAFAKDVTTFIRDTESDLLFHHSSRVFYWAAMVGNRRNLNFDQELLYCSCMFHDIGLVPDYSSSNERFEVDSAFVAADFLRSNGISKQDIDTVWTAIALHTTPGIPQHMHPVISLVTAGVEMDVLGIDFSDFSSENRNAVIAAHPRGHKFKERIIDAFYDGIKHKPGTTFGNVKSDVIVDKEIKFKPFNFCEIIRKSAWDE